MKTCYISLFCTEQIPIAYFCLHLYGLFLVGPRSNLELVEDTPIVFAPTNESRRPHRVPCGQALVNYGDYSVDKIQIAHFHLHLCLCCFWLVKTRLIGYETKWNKHRSIIDEPSSKHTRTVTPVLPWGSDTKDPSQDRLDQSHSHRELTIRLMSRKNTQKQTTYKNQNQF